MDYRLVQFNTHLFLGTVASLGNHTEYEDENRLNEIARHLSSNGGDFIALEEVWASSSRTLLVKKLHSTYNYSAHDAFGSMKMGSGLLFLSKYPIQSGTFPNNVEIPLFTEFNDSSGSDSYAEKGFLTFRTHPPGDSPFWFIHTHTQADYDSNAMHARASQFEQISAMIGQITKEFHEPVVVVGDLNVIGEFDALPGKEWQWLIKLFGKCELHDAYRSLHTDVETSPGLTYDGIENTLIPYFATEDATKQHRLDYFFAKKSSLNTAVVDRSFKYTDRKTNKLADLSDHYPLSVEFSII